MWQIRLAFAWRKSANGFANKLFKVEMQLKVWNLASCTTSKLGSINLIFKNTLAYFNFANVYDH